MTSKLENLYAGEESIRKKAKSIIADDPRLSLHLNIIEHAMDLADLYRQIACNDEDEKVLQVFAMRMFNAFGASLKLAFSGYFQNSALVLRDVLETVFLMDFFLSNRNEIARWRVADKKQLRNEFRPSEIRKALDKRDGFTAKKRDEIYDLFSQLAGHPTMKSAFMMRPQKDGDAFIGPFMEKTSLEAVLSEMGRLAIQVGEFISRCLKANDDATIQERAAFGTIKIQWVREFYGTSPKQP